MCSGNRHESQEKNGERFKSWILNVRNSEKKKEEIAARVIFSCFGEDGEDVQEDKRQRSEKNNGMVSKV